jgi:hypothetical protein
MSTRFLVMTIEGDPVAENLPTLDAAIEEATDYIVGGALDVYIYQAVRLVKQETQVIALDGDSIDA